MSDDTSLAVAVLARLDALELRVAILEAERAGRPHFTAPPNVTLPVIRNYMDNVTMPPTYEWHIDTTMRDTHNGNR